MDAGPSSDWWRTKLIKASDLYDQQFPKLEYVVPGIFPEGVTLFASRPKLGKSWLLLQVGTASQLVLLRSYRTTIRCMVTCSIWRSKTTRAGCSAASRNISVATAALGRHG
jgi:hypothetical protein